MTPLTHIATDVNGAENPRKEALYLSGGNLYLFLQYWPGTNQPVGVYRSTDSGTTWSLLSSGGPTIKNNASAYLPVQVGTTVYVVSRPHDINALDVQPFDLSTETWGTKVRGGPAVDGIPTGEPPLLVGCARTNGEIVVFYSDSSSAAQYAIYDTTTSAWTATNVALPTTGVTTHNAVAAVALDGAGRIHTLLQDAVTSSQDLYHVALLPGNTFGSVQHLATNVAAAGWMSSGASLIVTGSTLVVVMATYNPSDGSSDAVIARSATVADTPSFSSETISTGGGPGLETYNMAYTWFDLVDVGGEIVAIWTAGGWDSTSSIVLWSKRSSGGSWSMPEVGGMSPKFHNLHQIFAVHYGSGVIGIAYCGDDPSGVAFLPASAWYITLNTASTAPTAIQAIYYAY